MDKKKLFFFALSFIAFFSIYFYIFDNKLDLNGDNISYYLLGKSLNEGKGFTSIWNPGHVPHKHFPPGYPVIIAIFMFITKSYLFFKFLNGIFLFLSLLLFYKIFLIFYDDWRVILSAVIFIGVNIYLLRYSTLMMTEIPFIFFSLLLVWFLLKINYNKSPHKDINFIVSVLVLGFLFYIRSVGISIFGALVIFMLFNKKIKHLLYLVFLYMGLVLPWIIRNAMVTNSFETSYLEEVLMKNPYRPYLGHLNIVSGIERIWLNLKLYLSTEIPNGIFYNFVSETPNYFSTGGIIFSLIVIGLAIFGIIKIKKFSLFFAIYLGATFFILLLWPEAWTDVRFILPILPFLIIFSIIGLYEIINRFMFKINPLLLTILIIFNLSSLEELNIKAKSDYPPGWRNYFSIARYCKKNLTEEDIVCCRKPAFFYFFSEKKGLKHKFTKDAEKLLQDLKDNNVTYVVLDQLGFSSTFLYLLPAVKKYENAFDVVYAEDNPPTLLLKFKPDLLNFQK